MKRLLILSLLLFLSSPAYAEFGSCAFTEAGKADKVILRNNEQITNETNGKICLEGQGGTNNENICVDLESTANEALITSTTGLNLWDWGNVETEHGDNIVSYFGDGQEGAIMWDSLNTNDSLQIGTSVGDAAYSGYISIMEKADMGNANRDPGGTTANPTLRIYSADETSASDYIQFYHDGTNGVIETGTGDLNINTTIQISSGNAITINNPGSSPSGSTIYLGSPSADVGMVFTRGNGAGGTARRWDTAINSSNQLYIKDSSSGNIPIKFYDKGVYVEQLIKNVEILTIADNAVAASPASATLTPSTSFVKIDCQDADGCDITMGETVINDGQNVTIVNTSANTCNFADTAGVSELNGAFAMGQYDSLDLIYVTDTWVERGRSDN